MSDHLQTLCYRLAYLPPAMRTLSEISCFFPDHTRAKVKHGKEVVQQQQDHPPPPSRPASSTGSGSRLVPGGPCTWCAVTATPQVSPYVCPRVPSIVVLPPTQIKLGLICWQPPKSFITIAQSSKRCFFYVKELAEVPSPRRGTFPSA